MWEGVSHGGDFFLGGGVLKPGFWCVIRFKLTSCNSSSQCINDCSIRGGGPFLLSSNVLNTKGEGAL